MIPTDSNHMLINLCQKMDIMDKWEGINMLSNNNKSSIHSTVVSTKCQGNKYHQLLHKMVSIINQLITVNMVSNKTIMPNKIIRMALNMEKARLDKDTK